jgi:hypothetical protein
MYNFILQTIVMASLAVIIYLFARAMPRVSESSDQKQGGDYIEELLNKLPLEKADAFVSMAMEKMLRKFKVLILKVDNLLTHHLRNLKPTIGAGKNEAADQMFSGTATSLPEATVEKEVKSDNLK